MCSAGGFYTYILAMSQNAYENVGVSTPGNNPQASADPARVLVHGRPPARPLCRPLQRAWPSLLTDCMAPVRPQDVYNPLFTRFITYLLCVSLYGVFMLVPMRKTLVVDLDLPYPSGAAVGSMLNRCGPRLAGPALPPLRAHCHMLPVPLGSDPNARLSPLSLAAASSRRTAARWPAARSSRWASGSPPPSSTRASFGSGPAQARMARAAGRCLVAAFTTTQPLGSQPLNGRGKCTLAASRWHRASACSPARAILDAKTRTCLRFAAPPLACRNFNFEAM